MTRACDCSDLILHDLRETGAGTIEQIVEATGLNPRQVESAMRRLQSESVVEIAGTVPNPKGGRARNLWRLK